MFSHEGATRELRHDLALAGYLAFVGGWVDTSGFVLSAHFTSHVTGHVALVASETVRSAWAAVAVPASMLVAFFGGATAASIALEQSPQRRATTYSSLLLLEAVVIAVAWSVVPRASGAMTFTASTTPSAMLVLISFAMGLQNSLVTRLSMTVVRTTHVTGVVTDLGIEVGRWLRWWSRSGARARTPDGERPSRARFWLLSVILGAFAAGAAAGGFSSRQAATALWGAIVLLAAGAGRAHWESRRSAVGELRD